MDGSDYLMTDTAVTPLMRALAKEDVAGANKLTPDTEVRQSSVAGAGRCVFECQFGSLEAFA
jgi:hypothetical protein